MRAPRPGDAPPDAPWQDGRCDCRTRAEHDALCSGEIARRLEWATGRNGATLLAQIRAEGLDVVTVTKGDQP